MQDLAQESLDGSTLWSPLEQTQTARSERSDAGNLSLQNIDSMSVGTPLHDRNFNNSPRSSPPLGEDQTSGISNRRMSDKISNGRPNIGILAQKSRANEELLDHSPPTQTAKHSTSRIQEVADVIGEAKREMSKAIQRERSSRPLPIIRPDPDHQPDETLTIRFQESVDHELQSRRMNARDWLRLGMWWLLKVISPRQTKP